MVEAPGVEIALRPSRQFRAEGPLADRAELFARRYLDSLGEKDLPGVCLSLRRAAPAHVGLGTGTQLGLAVARLLAEHLGEPSTRAVDLARNVGRGERSAIGVYGFELGGFLIEGGKRLAPGSRPVPGAPAGADPGALHDAPPFAGLDPSPELSPLLVRHPLPGDWRWILLIPERGQGLCGREERAALGRACAQADQEACADLCRFALLGLLPAVVEADFVGFSEALHEFGRRVGACFSTAQHGIYLNADVADLVTWLHSLGVRGVGQTSWGPTVFGLAPDAERAAHVVRKLEGSPGSASYRVVVTTTNTSGARIVSE